MSNIERSPTADVELLAGEFIDIRLGTAHAFAEVVRRATTERCTLMESTADSEEAPVFFDQISLESFGPHKHFPEIPDLQGLVTFNPTAILPDREATWDKSTLASIRARLERDGYSVHTIPHDGNAIYVRVNKQFLTRIGTGTEFDKCYFRIDQITIKEFEEARADALSVNDSPYEPEATLTTISTALLLAVTSEEVLKTLDYGVKPHVRYLLKIDQNLAHDASSQTVESTALVLSEQGTKSYDGLPGHDDIEDGYRFSDLGGMTQVKQELDAIMACTKDPEGTSRYGVKPSHFILYGPRGTGKTSIIEALANEAGAKLHTIRSTDIFDKYVGRSAQNLKDEIDAIFDETGPQLVFIANFETIAASDDNSSTTTSHEEVKATLMQFIDDAKRYHPNVIIAAETDSDLGNISQGFIESGMLKPIEVRLPNTEELHEIWSVVITNSQQTLNSEPDWDAFASADSRPPFTMFANDIDCRQLAEKSAQLTGGTIKEIVAAAQYQAYTLYRRSGVDAPVTQQMLVTITDEYRRRASL